MQHKSNGYTYVLTVYVLKNIGIAVGIALLAKVWKLKYESHVSLGPTSLIFHFRFLAKLVEGQAYIIMISA